MTIDPACAISPLDVITALDKENIESRPIWKPMHQQPVFKDRDFICLRNGKSVGEALFERGLCLPSDIRNSDRDMDRIIGIVRGLFGKTDPASGGGSYSEAIGRPAGGIVNIW
jgi:dTDP-4-amino-4,6-dideoxygalactose transaminase